MRRRWCSLNQWPASSPPAFPASSQQTTFASSMGRISSGNIPTSNGITQRAAHCIAHTSMASIRPRDSLCHSRNSSSLTMLAPSANASQYAKNPSNSPREKTEPTTPSPSFSSEITSLLSTCGQEWHEIHKPSKICTQVLQRMPKQPTPLLERVSTPLYKAGRRQT